MCSFELCVVGPRRVGPLFVPAGSRMSRETGHGSSFLDLDDLTPGGFCSCWKLFCFAFAFRTYTSILRGDAQAFSSIDGSVNFLGYKSERKSEGNQTLEACCGNQSFCIAYGIENRE